MKRLILILAVCLLIAAPVLAQEATATPAPVVIVQPPPTDVISTQVMWAFVLVVCVVLVLVAWLLRPLIVKTAGTAPTAVTEPLFALVEKVLEMAAAFAARTKETTLDDTAVAELKQEFEAIKVEIRKLQQTTKPPIVQ